MSRTLAETLVEACLDDILTYSNIRVYMLPHELRQRVVEKLEQVWLTRFQAQEVVQE